MLSTPLFALLLSTTLALARLAPPMRCDIDHAHLVLPLNQTDLRAPQASPSPSFIAGAIGVQNYTCDSTTQTYTNIGAVAELFDISCLYGTSLFKTIQDDMFDEWSRRLDSFTIQDLIKEKQNDHAVLGQHYFIANGTAIAPKWDFTSASERGNVEAFTVGAKVGDLPVSGSVDWLSLDSVEGRLADRIYRVDTKSGLPPTSCVAGSPQISVKYAAKYWFFGGSF